jgi:hypothetical protein
MDDSGLGASLDANPAPALDAAPVEAPAPVAEPLGDELEGTEADLEEEVMGQGHIDPAEQAVRLSETEKASSDYKKTTSGHKTEDPGKKMVVDAAKLSTKGGPKSAPAENKASSNYKTMPKGNQVKNIKASGTEDPQGASNETDCGPGKADATGTTALKESDEEVSETTLEEILKELESSVNDVQVEPAPTAAPAAPVDEEIDLSSLLSEEKEEKEEEKDEDEDDEKEEKSEKKDNKPEWLKENASLKKELAEYRSAVIYLRDRLNEINLLNAKLLYTNKLFKQNSLTNEQKLRIIESFDLTKSVREAKLVYATLAESMNTGAKKPVVAAKKPVSYTVKTITEGLASKVVASTKPTKPVVITEGAEMANRFKKLAGIR